MKRILLFGATGRTGTLLVNYALEKGYAVTALVRNPEKLVVRSERLTIIKGLPTNAGDVEKAMTDCDIVISTLSALSVKESFSFKKMQPPHTLELSIRHAIESMTARGKKRIIILSSIGAGDSFPLAPWFMRVMIKITNFNIVFADHTQQEAWLRHSTLDWTIVRPVALNDDSDLKQLVVSYNQRPSPFKMSRKQLAKFMVDSIDNPAFIRKAPILSETV
jgi:putative NADH-flavin reductase